jgi:type II secretory pathway component PulJ
MPRPDKERRRAKGDEGVTLMELLVSMTLMTVFGALFTSAILLINKSTNKTQSVTISTASLNQAFLTLDKTVRYAAAITTPAQSTGTGDWYIEMQVTNTGAQQCTQFRLDITSGQLQSRSWSVVNSAASGLTSWRPLASGFTNGNAAATSTDRPFTLTAPTGSVQFPKLGITLVAKSGTTDATTSRSAVTFAAVNYVSDSSNTTIPCQQVSRP